MEKHMRVMVSDKNKSGFEAVKWVAKDMRGEKLTGPLDPSPARFDGTNLNIKLQVNYFKCIYLSISTEA